MAGPSTLARSAGATLALTEHAPPASLPNRRSFGRGLAATLFALPIAGKAWANMETGQEKNGQQEARGDTADQSGTGKEAAGANATGEAPVTRLRAGPGTLRLKPEPASETHVLSFNGSVPGPLLRIRKGERFSIEVENGLGEPLSLHWHGAGAPNAEDGVAGLTGPAIAPGATRNVSFAANRAGMFWYRPMTIGSVARLTESGLYGVLIVDEPDPPLVAKDLVLVIDDWSLDEAAQLRPGFDTLAARAGVGRLGNWLTMNSAALPERLTVATGERLRLRLLNAANARPIPLQFSGLTVQIIGVDGRPSEVFRPASDKLTLMPGGRFDLIVDAPAESGMEASVNVSLGAGMPLLIITTAGAASGSPRGAISATPAHDMPAAIRLQDAARATLTLAGGISPGQTQAASTATDPARIWTINGIAWPDALARPIFSVKSGRPVSLELKNTTALMQVLHIHGHHVRRLHNLDDGWEPYWLDVIAIPAGQTARVAFIAGEPGKWLIGSSIAERLDGGMASWFQITA